MLELSRLAINSYNRSYSPAKDLRRGARAVFHSLRPGSMRIAVLRPEGDLTNHAPLLRRSERAWKVWE